MWQCQKLSEDFRPCDTLYHVFWIMWHEKCPFGVKCDAGNGVPNAILMPFLCQRLLFAKNHAGHDDLRSINVSIFYNHLLDHWKERVWRIKRTRQLDLEVIEWNFATRRWKWWTDLGGSLDRPFVVSLRPDSFEIDITYFFFRAFTSQSFHLFGISQASSDAYSRPWTVHPSTCPCGRRTNI